MDVEHKDWVRKHVGPNRWNTGTRVFGCNNSR